jgi:preprotein translocase subunit SecG
MSIFINILLVVEVLSALLIILLVLMQRPKNEGLGAAFGGGMTENLFGAQTTNVLQSFTRNLGIFFFALTALISWLYVKQGTIKSDIQKQLAPLRLCPRRLGSRRPTRLWDDQCVPANTAYLSPLEAAKDGTKTTESPNSATPPVSGRAGVPAPNPPTAPAGEGKPPAAPNPAQAFQRSAVAAPTLQPLRKASPRTNLRTSRRDPLRTPEAAAVGNRVSAVRSRRASACWNSAKDFHNVAA